MIFNIMPMDAGVEVKWSTDMVQYATLTGDNPYTLTQTGRSAQRVRFKLDSSIKTLTINVIGVYSNGSTGAYFGYTSDNSSSGATQSLYYYELKAGSTYTITVKSQYLYVNLNATGMVNSYITFEITDYTT